MPVIGDWAAAFRGVVYSCIGGRVKPPALARAVERHAGTVTSGGRVLRCEPGTDAYPEDVYWIARVHLWDGQVEDELIRWDVTESSTPTGRYVM